MKVIAWGVGLWFLGYVLGIVLFMVVPKHLIGFFVMPIGVVATLWVLFKKIEGVGTGYYLKVAVAWTFLAIILDYVFVVRLFQSTDYYKPDVYLYYGLTFLLPLFVGWYKRWKRQD